TAAAYHPHLRSPPAPRVTQYIDRRKNIAIIDSPRWMMYVTACVVSGCTTHSSAMTNASTDEAGAGGEATVSGSCAAAVAPPLVARRTRPNSTSPAIRC